MKKVEIFTTPTCHYCKLAKEFLSHHQHEGFEIEMYDVTKDLVRRQELIDLGAMGVPLIRLTGGAETVVLNGFGDEEEDTISRYVEIGKYKKGE
jgi:glutaredoxin